MRGHNFVTKGELLMTWDIALDTKTGDWLFAPNLDFQSVEGELVVKQRVMTRIKIVRGAWPLDPTDGALGSRLEPALRIPIPRARLLRELPLMIEEALEPMDDVQVTNVSMVEEGTQSVNVTVEYEIIEEDDTRPLEERASESLTFELAA